MKCILRLLIDVSMFFMLFLVMAYNFTGNAIHEWSGMLLSLLFLGHLLLNGAWLRRIFRGRYSFLRIVSTSINLLLLLSFLVVLVAAVPISAELFPFFSFSEGMEMARIHIWASNCLFLLVALHCGIQWSRFKQNVNRKAKKRSRSRWQLVLTYALLLSVLAYGVRAFVDRGILYKITMYYTFDPGRADDSFLRFAADYLSIFILFASLTYYGFAWLRARRKQNRISFRA